MQGVRRRVAVVDGPRERDALVLLDGGRWGTAPRRPL